MPGDVGADARVGSRTARRIHARSEGGPQPGSAGVRSGGSMSEAYRMSAHAGRLQRGGHPTPFLLGRIVSDATVRHSLSPLRVS